MMKEESFNPGQSVYSQPNHNNYVDMPILLDINDKEKEIMYKNNEKKSKKPFDPYVKTKVRNNMDERETTFWGEFDDPQNPDDVLEDPFNDMIIEGDYLMPTNDMILNRNKREEFDNIARQTFRDI